MNYRKKDWCGPTQTVPSILYSFYKATRRTPPHLKIRDQEPVLTGITERIGYPPFSLQQVPMDTNAVFFRTSESDLENLSSGIPTRKKLGPPAHGSSLVNIYQTNYRGFSPTS